MFFKRKSSRYLTLAAVTAGCLLWQCSSPPPKIKPVVIQYPQNGKEIVDGLLAKKILSDLGAKMLTAEIDQSRNLDEQRLEVLEFLYQAFYNEYIFRLRGKGRDIESAIPAQDGEVFFDWRAYSIIRGRSKLFGYQSIIHTECSVTGRTRTRTLKTLCSLGLCPAGKAAQKNLLARLESEIANEVIMTAVLMKLKKREMGTVDAPPEVEVTDG